MIKEITLKNVEPYEEPAPIEITKPINLFYGLNGTGKTVLSDYLKHAGDKTKEGKDEERTDEYVKDKERFQSCNINGYDPTSEKILVYNQKFIQENFYEVPSQTQKGIFTLSSRNREAEEKVEKAKDEKKKLEGNLDTPNNILKDINRDREDKKSQAQEKIWKIVEAHGNRNDPLRFCLEGYMGDKKRLFQHIQGIGKPEKEPEKTTKALEKEAQALAEGQRIEPLQPISLDGFDVIENNSVFQEPIISAENNTVSEFIKRLNNADWVHKGLDYIPEPEAIIEKEECPFCQEKTISKDLAKKIRDCFSGVYEEKLNNLRQLKQQYTNLKENISPSKNEVDGNSFIQENYKNEKLSFDKSYSELVGKLDRNLQKIKDKIDAPNQEVELESTKTNLEQLNQSIEKINNQINSHNARIRDAGKTREEIKSIFWQIMRWKYDPTIARYQEDEEDIEKKIRETQKEVKEINKQITTQYEIITREQKNTSSIGEAIENINRELSYFGLEGFFIEQCETENETETENQRYRIVRKNQKENNFKTLSEGEKMVISFLYFIELCRGKAEQDEESKEKIVVIDDPISSLSHMYVFNVAMLIKEKFFKEPSEKIKQIFVLTHNLYFFHELTGRKSKNTNVGLFRITKGGEGSAISTMPKGEIRNEYQSYWQIVKDTPDKVTNPLLANCMRNILEYFFDFACRQDMQEALKAIDKNKYLPFIRYMDRESHFDAPNICDTKEIDVGIFKEAFKQVFIKTGYQAHYENHMGEKISSSDGCNGERSDQPQRGNH